MARKTGTSTYIMENKPCVLGFASIVGKKEGEGNLAKYFDKIYNDTTLGQKTWEKAESRLVAEAVSVALKKADLNYPDIDIIFSGDLLNQCISSTYGIRETGIPFLGLFGACSTIAESICAASLLIDSGTVQNCVCATSSHFCSAERQFRYPLEYGGQRPQSSQWTVTGSGGLVLGTEEHGICIDKACIGRIVDNGTTDANNMGAAMASAAADTLLRFFSDTGDPPEMYDLIATGDLGFVGSQILKELLAREGLVLGDRYTDCGLLIFDRDRQDVHSGGSGCGCCASVLCSYILNSMSEGKMSNVLVCATGALMSPTSVQQGESIPGIAHAVHLSKK
ncbi:MAG: stage V sporulation protein AD [Clostridia bacterium]|nr:stage V sporulation protein AD [Clostridia bacterium]